MDLFAVEESQGIDYETETDAAKKSIVEEETLDLVESSTDDSVMIKEEAVSLPEYLTYAVIQSGQIDPMIGMANISPYDFMK